MSYKEVREFVEIIKQIECPENVEIDSFQFPNFGLVAKILRWLVQRCDPAFQIPLEIEADQDRVFFLKAITDHLASRYNLILDPRKLYLADGYAVRELLKVARLMKNAEKVWEASEAKGQELFIDHEDAKAKLLANVMDLRALIRKNQSMLTASSAQIFEMLKKEPDNHVLRINALNMKLDPIKVENSLNESIAGVTALSDEYVHKFENIEFDKANLETKIKKREEELERMQRRYQTMQGTKPTHLDESDKMAAELKDLYEEYCTKFRSLIGLENEVQKMQIALDNKERAILGKDESEVQGVDDLNAIGLDTGVIDDGFNEDPDDDQDPQFNRRAERGLGPRADAIDEVSTYSRASPDEASDDEQRPSSALKPVNGNHNQASSDDDF